MLGQTHSERINTLVTDLVTQSQDQPEIRLSPEVFTALDALRDFMFEQVYLREGTREEHEKAVKLIRDLFAYYLEHPDELPAEYHRSPGDLPTHVADSHRRHDGPVRPADLRAALPSPGVAPLERGTRMAGRIRQDDIEAVKERTDLVKLVGQYLTLKKTGHDSMSGLCPFHQEKTPSFSVSPAKQVFYCFGCGKGGDAITFLRELEHLTYVEAVERLASQAGVSLRYEGDSPSERRAAAAPRRADRRERARREPVRRASSPTRPRPRRPATYLAGRGITPESVERVRHRLRAARPATSCSSGSARTAI